ncbi:WD40 repeat domain-containing protein [Vairimorpha necatrix]|uniref:WD40 repeat domain-containing protein n=1 Tax=Vairimorpha necatrix TaxID=6039 RepID=A0AAX4JD62_9MICR
MIKLTKPEINSLINNYLSQESLIYTSFVFKNEIKEDFKNIRKDITLEKILTYGLQYMYGVDHYKDGKINVCKGTYSLDRLHLCDAVVRKKKKKREESQEGESLLVEQTNSLCKKSIKGDENSINSEIQVSTEGNHMKDQHDNMDSIIDNNTIKYDTKLDSTTNDNNMSNHVIVPLDSLSTVPLSLSVKSLDPCKPCSLVTFKDEYLYLYDNSSFTLYIFKFGSFAGIKNIALEKMLYVDDILVMYDGSKLIFYNTFNLKVKSIMITFLDIFYDGSKFVTLNLDGSISYFTRDGNKSGENIFIFENILSAFINNNMFMIWNDKGKLCILNTKTQSTHFFTSRDKSVLSSSYYKDILYLLYEDTIGIYNINEKTEKYIKNENMTGICKTKEYILTYNKNILTVYKDDIILKVYDTKKDIKEILSVEENIIIIYNKEIWFYDQEIQLEKEYKCEDEIEKISINNKEVCVLLKKSSPILILLSEP